MLAHRAGAPVSAAQFLADVQRVAAVFPPSRHVINVCVDRYRFLVGFAAGALSGRVSLLPPTHTPEVVRHLARFAPAIFCLTDEIDCSIELPKVLYPETPRTACTHPEGDWHVPQIDAETEVAIVFTSGSTGVPLPHRKTWGRLVQCVRAAVDRLAFTSAHTVLATVPPQHMYGFESSVLLPLLGGGKLCAARPFYPADVCADLQRLARPRALVTTPIHLRALLASETQIPDADLIVSATAPLGVDLAGEAERRFHAPLMEIYGSTETGQIASRRTAIESEWRLWPGVRLSLLEREAWVEGGHVEQPTALCDAIEPAGSGYFRLHGRLADLVNIAGKRNSLAHLTHQLNSVPGVLDGAFFFPSGPNPDPNAQRVAAAAVAPTLDAAGILKALRQRIDPVFLPRPLILVERLPRNSTGKLPQQALQALLDAPHRVRA